MDNTEHLSFFLSAISQVGFPIFLAGYLLFRFEKKLETLSESISRLKDDLNKISEEIQEK
ncbi:YvrJ family protein [Paenibacillus beijingensis]|uniref:Uncharacterized protein n=1 Tax=Paenibacillus beijingensis TaxID=1126833 RepID=A0A0D5NFH4_9BACL|nr:YvrJ family protein [Paenibacillus beijingensis]AJY73905.1 hypothetical protein VN24_03865 [Paenibacillus beijingensis]